MPIYEFKCRDCGDVFEHLCLGSGDKEPPRCPSCASEKTERQLSTISSFAGNTQKGSSIPAGTGCSPSGGFS